MAAVPSPSTMTRGAGPCSALGAALGKPRPAGMEGCCFLGAERAAPSG